MMMSDMGHFSHRSVVSDINRIAAVVQAVVKEGDTIYGSLIYLWITCDITDV